MLAERFTAATVTGLRHTLIAAVQTAGMCDPAAEDFVLAVHELVTNAVRHGGGAGLLQMRLLDDVLTCEVIDHGDNADGCRCSFPRPTSLAAADCG